MLLSGDDLTTITIRRAEMLKKLAPPSGVAAEVAEIIERAALIQPLGSGGLSTMRYPQISSRIEVFPDG
jgi:hypothetical protein